MPCGRRIPGLEVLLGTQEYEIIYHKLFSHKIPNSGVSYQINQTKNNPFCQFKYFIHRTHSSLNTTYIEHTVALKGHCTQKYTYGFYYANC